MKKVIPKRIFLAVALSICGMSALAIDVSAQKQKYQTARVEIGQYGYEPVSISLKKGIPARITFLRKTDDTCATEVLFPDYGIRRDLPLNQAVVISLTPAKAGEFAFTCGMNMHRGKMIVR